MRSTTRRLRTYRREERDFSAATKRIEEEFADEFDACGRFTDVPCPSPDYPDPPKVPSLNEEIKELRAVSEALGSMQAEVSSRRPPDELSVLQTQLITAIESLKDTAEHNADVLAEAIVEPEGEGGGGFNKGKISTLRKEEALPSIRALNRTAIGLIRRMGLPLDSYDVPGGRDRDPKDASTEV